MVLVAQNQMQIKGFKAIINSPVALKGEQVHGLPPHCPIPAYNVDEFDCPPHWMHGSENASSYFVGLQLNRGLWFDFTQNVYNEHHVAVVVSVQGINPITSQPARSLNLEQYRDKCPVHNIKFLENNLCSECGYSWPRQNYLASTTGQPMWIDGFLNKNGVVQQYLVTEDFSRGIAAQMIGDERVFAFGFAFYLSKTKRPKPEPMRFYGAGMPVKNSLVPEHEVKTSGYMLWHSGKPNTGQESYTSGKASYSLSNHTEGVRMCSSDLSGAVGASSLKRGIQPAQVKVPEIAGGAMIQQDFGCDDHDIDFWDETPAGFIYVNFVLESEIAKMAKKAPHGALSKIKVGNP